MRGTARSKRVNKGPHQLPLVAAGSMKFRELFSRTRYETSRQLSLVGTTVTLTGVYAVDGREIRSASDDVGSEGDSKRGAGEAASETKHTERQVHHEVCSSFGGLRAVSWLEAPCCRGGRDSPHH